MALGATAFLGYRTTQVRDLRDDLDSQLAARSAVSAGHEVSLLDGNLSSKSKEPRTRLQPVISMLENFARRAGLNISSIETEGDGAGATHADTMQPATTRLSGSGPYKNVRGFLDLITGPETTLILDRVEITPSNSSATEVNFQATVHPSLY